MEEVVPAHTSPTLHPPSPPTVHQLSRLALSELKVSQEISHLTRFFDSFCCPTFWNITVGPVTEVIYSDKFLIKDQTGVTLPNRPHGKDLYEQSWTYFHHGRIIEVWAEEINVDGGWHEDKFEVRSLLEDSLDDPEQEVGVDVAFMDFVNHYHTVLLK